MRKMIFQFSKKKKKKKKVDKKNHDYWLLKSYLIFGDEKYGLF